jgi:hypothetical protein
MWGPGDIEKAQGSSGDHHSSTYRIGGVALEGASVDLDIGLADKQGLLRPIELDITRVGNWRKVQEISWD